jgi:hypothetical protein
MRLKKFQSLQKRFRNFEADKFTAAIEGDFVDYWERVR